jgi:hypothetical protein
MRVAMSRAQITIFVILGILAAIILVGLGYVLRMVTEGAGLPIVSGLQDPHGSPEAVARAWLEAVAAGDCEGAKAYIPPDEDGFFCDGEDAERIVSATIDKIDADPLDSPLAEYRVTLYGSFTLHLYPLSGPKDEMGKLLPVERKSIRLAVKEIDGEYYVTSGSAMYLMLMRPQQ